LGIKTFFEQEVLIQKRLKEFFNKEIDSFDLKTVNEKIKDKINLIEIEDTLNAIKNLDCKDSKEIEEIENRIKILL